MAANPFLGLIFHWIGGLAAASFYIPYRFVKKWSWETFWLVGGVFSWIAAPLVAAAILVPGFGHLIPSASPKVVFLAFFFGALWGVGGLTFGLTMRYLGIALGMAVALGFCAAFGTLMPPLFDGSLGPLAHTRSGQTILEGIAACLLGIAISGFAGMSKERELSDEQKRAVTSEFNFPKGMLVATFSGILSSCMAYGLAAGKPIADLAKAQLAQTGGSDLWQNLPVLVVVLLGGFTTNVIWCGILNARNKTGGEYFGRASSSGSASALGLDMEVLEPVDERFAAEAVGTGVAVATAPSARAKATSPALHDAAPARQPLAVNYALCALAGVTWYLQFFFYSMGQVKMGAYSFASWTIHMASIIIFSTLWGISLREWKGTSSRTHALLGLGLAVLIGSTVVIGVGNYMKVGAGH